jgi:peptide/nickel transport system permease protein
MWLFALNLRWFPSGGIEGAPFSFEWLRYMILPTITLAWTSTGLIARLTRSSMLESINQDYIRTARAKGLSQRLIIYKHALRNSLIPVITYIGLEFGFLLGGAVVTETIFSLPGLGRFVVQSIAARDYPVIQASILFMASVFVFINLAVDILYSVIDPRIRYS